MFSTWALSACLLALAVGVNTAPIDDYVWRADEHYGWVDLGSDWSWKGTVSNRSYTAHTLNMTSLKWLNDEDYTADSQAKAVWWHYLVVIVPDNIEYKNNGTIWITGGSQGNGYPSSSDEDVLVSAALATSVGVVTGAFFQIPNEHITFAADPILKSRSEDAIIAYCWDHFLKDPSQPEWLVRFPMVKASLRAMDAMKEFMLVKYPSSGVSLDYFSVSGASKRGWTTWLVGAVDPKRVQIIVPIVLDAINFVTVEHHQFRSYGGWTYALQDYTDMNITYRFDDPNMLLLQQNEDPYFFRDRLTMPKLVVNAGMDEFQQPDDTRYWWNDMPEPKHFLMVPNAEHSLATGIFVAVPSIGAFIQAHLHRDLVPRVTWKIDDASGQIVATLGKDGIVHTADVWWAYSCGANSFDNGKFRRDYRVAHLDNPCGCGLFAEGYCANINAKWMKKELTATTVNGLRTYTAQLDAPTDGRWVAFFIDFKFVNKHAFPLDVESLYKRAVRRPEDETPGSRIDRENFGGFPHDFGRFFEFTTEVSVFPNTFPYEDCHGEACGNRLL